MNHRRGFTYGVKVYQIKFKIYKFNLKKPNIVMMPYLMLLLIFQHKNKETTMWTCSVRSATIRCRATVLQRGNSFVRGANVHVHPADLKLPHLKKVSAQVVIVIELYIKYIFNKHLILN